MTSLISLYKILRHTHFLIFQWKPSSFMSKVFILPKVLILCAFVIQIFLHYGVIEQWCRAFRLKMSRQRAKTIFALSLNRLTTANKKYIMISNVSVFDFLLLIDCCLECDYVRYFFSVPFKYTIYYHFHASFGTYLPKYLFVRKLARNCQHNCYKNGKNHNWSF